jgi:pyruvate/2-oxoglutarate dehydrogenase complex dihydrolipoamide acyltransferase (E2) component
MKHTVLLGPREGVGIVARHDRVLGEYVAPGDSLLTIRFDGADDEPILSDRHGVVFKWAVLPGEAVEAGEPLVILAGTSPDSVPPEREVPADTAAVARHHVASWRTAPHVATVVRVSLSEVLRLAEKAGCGPLPFLIAGIAAALRAHPAFNRGDSIRLAVGSALLVDADRQSVLQLSRALDRPEPVERASFTITDLSDTGIVMQTPILRQPQVGHLTIGAIADEHVHLTLVHDARIATEAEAAGFLATVRQNIEQANFLFV